MARTIHLNNSILQRLKFHPLFPLSEAILRVLLPWLIQLCISQTLTNWFTSKEKKREGRLIFPERSPCLRPYAALNTPRASLQEFFAQSKNAMIWNLNASQQEALLLLRSIWKFTYLAFDSAALSLEKRTHRDLKFWFTSLAFAWSTLRNVGIIEEILEERNEKTKKDEWRTKINEEMIQAKQEQHQASVQTSREKRERDRQWDDKQFGHHAACEEKCCSHLPCFRRGTEKTTARTQHAHSTHAQLDCKLIRAASTRLIVIGPASPVCLCLRLSLAAVSTLQASPASS